MSLFIFSFPFKPLPLSPHCKTHSSALQRHCNRLAVTLQRLCSNTATALQ